MRERLIEDLLGSELHATLLRFLAAADEGLDESFLSRDERSAVAEMEVAGAVRRKGGRVRLVPEAREAVAKALPNPGGSRSAAPSPAHLDFIQELTRVMTRSRNVADLMRSSFATLASAVPFDLAAAVLLEQNIDVYVTRRAGLEDPLSDRFAIEVRGAMQKVLDVASARPIC